MLYTLKNDNLVATIDDLGAQIISVKRADLEYIWYGNAEFWAGHAPILFPICGRLFEGKYTFEGKDVSRFSDSQKSELRAKKIGFLFQDSTMIQALTLRENLIFTQGVGGKKDLNHVDELLYQFGLEDRADFFPHQLSGGQRRRAMAARALIHDPALILADEPTNDLDEHWSEEIIRILNEQTKKGTAVVMVTHNSRWAQAANRRLRLEDGILVNLAE